MESSKKLTLSRKAKKNRINDQKWSYPFLIPAAIAVNTIVIIPFLIDIYYSFTK